MPEKVRYINFNPTEFNDGIAGEELGADGVGVYWISCSIIYAKGEAFVEEEWLKKKIKALSGSHMRTISACVDRLVKSGKMVRKGSEITAKRVRNELESATKRIQNSRKNGAKGGRPSNKNKDLEKGLGLKTKNLPITNNQDQDTNIQDGEFLNPNDDDIDLNRGSTGRILLRSKTIEDTKVKFPNWSTHALEDAFNELNEGKCVKFPDKAFIAFVRKHTAEKGQNP